MPNRNSQGNYRYNYQGQELDNETGKVAFQLRLYDPRINRWLTTDPAGQYYSPYLSMGNNWITGIDPDGARKVYYNSDGTENSITHDNWFHNFFFGTQSYIYGDSGSSYKLHQQGVDLITSGEFSGFKEDWLTSKDSDGYGSLFSKAIESKGNRNLIEYIFKESHHGGKLDSKQYLDKGMLYGADKMAYTKNGAGNFVWGAALKHFGFPDDIIRGLAHGGTMYLETVSQPNKKGHGWSMSDIVHRLSKLRFDDEIPQIQHGINHHRGYSINN